jgi:hypothetical protein
VPNKESPPPDEAAAALSRPAQVDVVLRQAGIFSTQVASMVRVMLADRGQLITHVGGTPLRDGAVLAHPQHVIMALDDLLAMNRQVAGWVESERAKQYYAAQPKASQAGRAEQEGKQ